MGAVQTDAILIRGGEGNQPQAVLLFDSESRFSFRTNSEGSVDTMVEIAIPLGRMLALTELGHRPASMTTPIAFHAAWNQFLVDTLHLDTTHVVLEGPMTEFHEMKFEDLTAMAEHIAALDEFDGGALDF